MTLQRSYDGYLRKPQVSVFEKEFNSKKVFVLGGQKAGHLSIRRQNDNCSSHYFGGWPQELSGYDRLILTRVVQGEEKKFEVPFKEISQGRTSNVFLQPGDIVFVPESWF